jgi:hypothetical protein
MPLPLLALTPMAPVPPAGIAPALSLPLTAPAPPLPGDAFPAYIPPKTSLAEEGGLSGSVETFDPVARAELIASRIPRTWRGSYRPFERGAAPQPVQLLLDSVAPSGQMVVLRGRLLIAGLESPFQGNINAKSDQLDLLPLASSLGAGLEGGGEFQGLQGLSLSGWHAPRLTNPGGRLQLVPGPAPQPERQGGGGPIRGLW